MLSHAFDTLGCNVVGWRTDNFNHASQRAIERLGARKDGVIRGHAMRRDGTIRDTVMYSLRSGEWPEVKAQLLYLLDKPRDASPPRSESAMLIDFFYTLRSAKLPVSVKEYLTLLEALQADVVGPNSDGAFSLDDFYYLIAHRAGQGREALRQVRPRLCRLFQGRRDAGRLHQGSAARLAAQDAGARVLRRGKGQDREDGLGRAHGDAQEALRGAEGTPRRRQQVDRHGRHLALRPRRLQPAGHPHRRRRQEQERRQGVGPARLQGLRRHAGAGHPQHQDRAAPAAQVRPRRPRGRAGPGRDHPARPPPTPATSTSRCGPSATTTSRCCC